MDKIKYVIVNENGMTMTQKMSFNKANKVLIRFVKNCPLCDKWKIKEID